MAMTGVCRGWEVLGAGLLKWWWRGMSGCYECGVVLGYADDLVECYGSAVD